MKHETQAPAAKKVGAIATGINDSEVPGQDQVWWFLWFLNLLKNMSGSWCSSASCKSYGYYNDIFKDRYADNDCFIK